MPNYIWDTVDYDNRPVFLSTQTVVHIEEQRQLIGVNWPQVVKSVIETPDMVIMGNYADTEIHLMHGLATAFSGMWLHVPVVYQAGEGDVRTCIVANKPKDRKILYIRKDLFK